MFNELNVAAGIVALRTLTPLMPASFHCSKPCQSPRPRSCGASCIELRAPDCTPPGRRSNGLPCLVSEQRSTGRSGESRSSTLGRSVELSRSRQTRTPVDYSPGEAVLGEREGPNHLRRVIRLFTKHPLGLPRSRVSLHSLK